MGYKSAHATQACHADGRGSNVSAAPTGEGAGTAMKGRRQWQRFIMVIGSVELGSAPEGGREASQVHSRVDGRKK